VIAEDALAALRETIRVRHCSCRSGQAYLDWARRFFDYLREIGATVEGRPLVTQATIRDFISHLATRRQVAASTRNQAFAAIPMLQRVDLRQIRELLGYRSVETTMINTHVVKDLRTAPRSPLDAL
jgi:site-specific recombinase XerC